MNKKRSQILSLVAPILISFVLLWVPRIFAQSVKQTNLVSDISGMAGITDPLLVNPWGMSSSATSPIWVSDAGTGMATLYSVDGTTGAVTKVALNVTVPGPPSGQLFNGTSNFVVSNSGASAPALFIFAGLNGVISGWNAAVPPPSPSKMAIAAALGAPAPAVYTGITQAVRGTDPFLYAANNAAGRIDVFDKNFVQVSIPGAFLDPSLPAGDKPFNIAAIGGSLYVTYSGPVGVVNVFNTDGIIMKRFATGGTLLSPWGITMAPADFGKFSNDLLIGNFNSGDPAVGPGNISAFDPATGTFLGLLTDPASTPISIDGLWTLKFGNGGNGGINNVLYFSAGIQRQAHGLFGSLASCGAPGISGTSASPNILWPPNHRFVPVTVDYTVSAGCDAAPVCTLSVSSNEGSGSNFSVIDDHHVALRAERDGGGDGRIYTITVGCADKFGVTSRSTVDVTVPHDLGQE